MLRSFVSGPRLRLKKAVSKQTESKVINTATIHIRLNSEFILFQGVLLQINSSMATVSTFWLKVSMFIDRFLGPTFVKFFNINQFLTLQFPQNSYHLLFKGIAHVLHLLTSLNSLRPAHKGKLNTGRSRLHLSFIPF